MDLELSYFMKLALRLGCSHTEGPPKLFIKDRTEKAVIDMQKNMKALSTMLFVGALIVLTLASLIAMAKASTWAQSLTIFTKIMHYGG